MNHMNPKVAWTILIVFAVIAIGAVGYFSYKYYQEASKPTPTVTPTTTTPATTTDATADWKTYINDSHYFTLKYPNDMTQSVNNTGTIIFKTQDNKKNFNINFVAGPLDPNNIKGVYGKQTTTIVTVGTQNGYQYKEGDAGCSSEVIQTSLPTGEIMELSFPVCDNETNELYTNSTLRSQILSTFKFTTVDETASWKTYNDSVFGWQLKYPSSFSVQEKGALGTSQKNVNSIEFRKDNNLAFTINDYNNIVTDNQFKTPFSGTIVSASYDNKISEQLTKLNSINAIELVTSTNNKQSKAYYLRNADNKLISIAITSNYLNDSEVIKILNTFQL